MREIKFRAWHKETKTMCYVNNIHFPTRTVQLWVGKLLKYDTKCIEDVELMQYTGLKDKNEVEVYEGDVVSFLTVVAKDYTTGREIKEKTYGRVFYEIDTSAFSVEKMHVSNLQFLCDIKNIEVVGNIYENPELLQRESEKE